MIKNFIKLWKSGAQMKVEINGFQINIEKRKTKIYGLNYLPQLSDHDNNADWLFFTKTCQEEISNDNYNLVLNLSSKYFDKGILEIGVNRNNRSFTHAILDKKPDHIKYLGVDIEDKSSINNAKKNIFTLKENSFNQTAIRNFLKEINLNHLSFILIDGWHSLNACINDWQYADLLAENGVVVFHDTNSHPGPAIFLDAINPDIFRVEKFFQKEDDYGMAIAYKL